MLKYLIKKEIEKEATQKGKKAVIYTGIVLAGVGAYFTYKAIKNRNKFYDEFDDIEYLNDDVCECEDCNCKRDTNYKNQYKKEDELEDELEEKIEEINSRRINYQNCPHVSKEDLDQYVNNIENEKKKVDIDKEQYKEGYYDKYEFYEDDKEK